jgi:hypothetical protein
MTRRLTITIVALTLLLLALIRASSGGMVNPFADTRALGTWVAAFFTLCMLSFLYGDNPFFRFAEHVFVGVSAAYWMVMAFWRAIVPNLLGNLVPELPAALFGMDLPTDIALGRRLVYLVPLLLGLLLLARFHPKGRPVSTWALAFTVGTTAGLRLVSYLQSDFMAQVDNSVQPLVALHDGAFDAGRTLSAVVLVVGLLCSLAYFYFSRERRGLLGAASRVGVWVLMVTFGAGFGFTVMGRVALLVGRMEFLLRNWLGLI